MQGRIWWLKGEGRGIAVGRGVVYIVLTKGHQNAKACSYAARSGAIRPEVRYAKWAGGSRSQTHRRAAKGGFTQDDGYVQGVAPDALRSTSSGSFSNTLGAAEQFQPL